MTEREGCRTLIVEDWKTPATDYPEKKVGSAEIRRSKIKGLYLMEGVAGYDFYCSDKPITVTSLYINGEEVMVDDPLQMKGMEKLAEHSEGNTLVGGLGLGLVVHELAKNPKVKKIVVVEKNKDVIDLIKPFLPNDKVTIEQGDVLDEKWYRKCPDTVILDIWWWRGGSREGFGEMMSAFGKIKLACPNTKVYIWGTNIPEINPAVEKPLCPVAKEFKIGRLRV